MTETIADIVGIAGVIAIVFAYFALQTERLKHDDIAYHMLNLVGASMILYSVIISWNLASFIIELIWIAISIYGIYKVIKKQRNEKDIDGQ